jgi:hypothetical protein
MERTAEKVDVYLESIYNTVIDNYEKVVLTLDRLTVGNYDGIRVVNLLDWLTED